MTNDSGGKKDIFIGGFLPSEFEITLFIIKYKVVTETTSI